MTAAAVDDWPILPAAQDSLVRRAFGDCDPHLATAVAWMVAASIWDWPFGTSPSATAARIRARWHLELAVRAVLADLVVTAGRDRAP